MKEKIILIGAGGHAKACIDVIEQENHYKIAGLIDKKEKIGANVLGYKVIGCDSDIPKLIKKYKNLLITIGQIKSSSKREEMFNSLKMQKAIFPTIISPKANVSKHSKIGEGTIILHGAFINANVKIGNNCIINTLANIEHDTVIEDNCHISTRSVINGGCFIGHNSFIGSASVIVNNVSIPSNTVIGAGSVVTKSIKKSGTYVGSPAKKVR